MAGYDPKQKRAHSPAAEEHAPVDDLLGAPAEPTPAPEPAPAPAPAVEPEPAPVEARETTSPAEPMAPITGATGRPAPVVTHPAPPGRGPLPRLMVLGAAVVAAFAVWRWRRR
jgi:hypothetical protein